MIPYSRHPEHTIPTSAVKIIGLGGAGANMLERIAIDGMEGTELLALNTDIRTLSACIAKDKIQLGTNLTRGLGAGGDPDLGQKAALEAESEIRAAVKGRRIVFLCTGLGGGTGSGAAPLVTRIAREEGAFVVVFATIPFAFEGQRRREQAETSLNELAVLANALVTFDNNRMGELVLAKQGIHDAFVAADHMISESIKAVIRLVVRPGLINIGLDELMSALKSNRSRCLFGSGLASGKDRASKALRGALSSPLLDQGSLLKETHTVLVHLCGGEDLTLFEVELLMQQLHKHVPQNAQVLFGAAVDPSMGDALSITLISSLPEESLAMAPRVALTQSQHETPAAAPTTPAPTPAPSYSAPQTAPSPATPTPMAEPVAPAAAVAPAPAKTPASPAPSLFDEVPFAEPEHKTPAAPEPAKLPSEPEPQAQPEPAPAVTISHFHSADVGEPAAEQEPAPMIQAATSDAAEEVNDGDDDKLFSKLPSLRPIPEKRPPGEAPRLGKIRDEKIPVAEIPQTTPVAPEPRPEPAPEPAPDAEIPRLKLGVKAAKPQSELGLDTVPRGRFEGENPNVFEGEDLDLPPFLRKKK